MESAVRNVLTEDEPEAMRRAWLKSDVVSAFNESVYYPYTSLKYHSLLVAALLDKYRAGTNPLISSWLWTPLGRL